MKSCNHGVIRLPISETLLFSRRLRQVQIEISTFKDLLDKGKLKRETWKTKLESLEKELAELVSKVYPCSECRENNNYK